MSVVVNLTDDQMESVQEFLEAAREAEISKEPGMVLAQVFNGHMRVGFLPNAKAAAVVLALGGDIKHFSRTAFGKPELKVVE